jgi:DNA invertase Pin-like site-specific DNA recombinase
MKRAALYLRSSKDRNDVSPDAQRRALQELAASRGETIAEEFVDTVESGKDTDRPGFQALLRAIHNPKRGWDTILMYDTARLARRREISIIFEETDCRRNGVRVVYRSLPDMPALSELLLKSVMQAMDEYHSLSSRERGLAGMAENVRKGWRAGGKAPLGYRLKHVQTGAARDGAAVTKTVLEPDPGMAPKVSTFLKLRATGLAPAKSAEQAGLTSTPRSSLVGMEWNALTYAGHTVWNVHAESGPGGYVGGAKRRPRSEWLIQHDTHPALITHPEAETLLSRLEARAAARQRQQVVPRDRGSSALLGGRLVAPDEIGRASCRERVSASV